MKGIVKYQGKYYKKSTKSLKEGDLVKLECPRGDYFFRFNGIYVVNKGNEIHAPFVDEDGKKCIYGIKLGYNVYNRKHYSKLVEVQRKKSLPSTIKEEQEY